MRTHLYCIFLILVLLESLSACDPALINDTDQGAIDTLHVDTSILKSHLQLKIVPNSLKYVKLQNSTLSTITKIDQIQIYRDIIYILDGKVGKLLAFDLKGSYLFSIKFNWSQILQFEVYENSIYIFDRTRLTMYQFDLRGRLINKANAGSHGAYFTILHDGTVVYNTAGLTTNDHDSQNYQLAIIHNNKPTLKLPFDRTYRGMKYIFENQFTKKGRHVNFISAFNNTIYVIDTGQIKAITKFDFGKYNMPDSVYLNHQRYNDYNTTNYVVDLTNPIITSTLSFFKFSWKGTEGYLFTDDLYTTVLNGGVGCVANAASDFNDPIPKCAYKDRLVAIVDPRTLMTNSRTKELQFDKQFNVADVKVNDNPYLMFYSLDND